MMNNSRFVSSFYYPDEPQATEFQDQPFARSISPVQAVSPYDTQVAQYPQQSPLMMQQQARQTRLVERRPAVEKPFIPSQYFNSRGTYSMKHPVCVNRYYPDVMQSPSMNMQNQFYNSQSAANFCNIENIAPAQVCRPTHQHVNVFPTYPSNTNIYPAEHSPEPLTCEPIKKKQATKTSDYSDYAWKRTDEEKRQQPNPVKSNECDQDFSPAEASPPLQAEALHQPVTALPASKCEDLATPLQTHTSRNYMKATDSEYLGIPNDLYPAYRKTVPIYNCYDERKEKSATFKGASVTVSVPEGPVANDTCSDIDKCDTAQENPAFSSRFTCQIKPGQAAAPVRNPDLAHYTTQYSAIGNAFTPVGQPQISEYHYEDLNDLASCIDAI